MNISTLSDVEVVDALLARNERVTYGYLYRKCLPLFRAVYEKYYTDCDSVDEFINEVYVHLMTAKDEDSLPRLASFNGKCSLTMWLKIVVENFCRSRFERQGKIIEESLDEGDRLQYMSPSLEMNCSDMDTADLQIVLRRMPNERYRRLIELRYLQDLSNEETAKLLDMTMTNFYNKHKLAKAQFLAALRKEGIL